MDKWQMEWQKIKITAWLFIYFFFIIEILHNHIIFLQLI